MDKDGQIMLPVLMNEDTYFDLLTYCLECKTDINQAIKLAVSKLHQK